MDSWLTWKGCIEGGAASGHPGLSNSGRWQGWVWDWGSPGRGTHLLENALGLRCTHGFHAAATIVPMYFEKTREIYVQMHMDLSFETYLRHQTVNHSSWKAANRLADYHRILWIFKNNLFLFVVYIGCELWRECQELSSLIPSFYRRWMELIEEWQSC